MNNDQKQARSRVLERYSKVTLKLIKVATTVEFGDTFTHLTTKIPPKDKAVLKSEILRLAKPCARPYAISCSDYDVSEIYLADMRCIIDPVVKRILDEELGKWQGQYTVGVFEAISDKALYKKNEQLMKREQEIAQFQLPTLQMGVHVRRNEERLFYAMPVTMVKKGHKFTGSTMNMSVNGCMIKAPHSYFLQIGDLLEVDFSHFENEYTFAKTPICKYRVVYISRHMSTLRLGCVKEDTQPEWSQFLAKWIEQSKGKYKIDVSPSVHAAYDRSFEDLLSSNSMWMPIMIGIAEGKAHLKYVLETTQNKKHFDNFRTENGTTAITSMLDAPILKSLLQNGSALVFKITTSIKGKTVFIAETYENLQKNKMFELFINYGIQKGKLTCYLMRMQKIAPEQVENAISSEKYNKTGFDLKELETTEKEIKTVTHMISLLPLPLELNGESSYSFSREQLKQLNGLIKKRKQEALQRVGSHVQELRGESRYFHQLECGVVQGREEVSAITSDISLQGTRLNVSQPVGIQIGDQVDVVFPEFKKEMKKLKVKSFSYHVRFVANNNKTLHLQVAESSAENVKSLFQEYISDNRGSMKLDSFLDNVAFVSGCLKRLYSSHYPGVSVSISKNKVGRFVVDKMLMANRKSDEMAAINILSHDAQLSNNIYPLFCTERHDKIEVIPLARSTNDLRNESDIIYVEVDGAGEVKNKQTKTSLSPASRRQTFINQAKKEGSFKALYYEVIPANVEKNEWLKRINAYIKQYSKHSSDELLDNLSRVQGIFEFVVIDEYENLLVDHIQPWLKEAQEKVPAENREGLKPKVRKTIPAADIIQDLDF